MYCSSASFVLCIQTKYTTQSYYYSFLPATALLDAHVDRSASWCVVMCEGERVLHHLFVEDELLLVRRDGELLANLMMKVDDVKKTDEEKTGKVSRWFGRK